MMSLVLAAGVAGAFAFANEAARSTASLAPLLAHVSQHRDGRVPHSIDFAALEGDRAKLPIGVFDSGIGGLTVLEAILKLDAFNNATLQPGADGVPDFAGEKFIYLGDQANMPYGNYPANGREDYLRELIVKDAVFLLGKRYHGAGGAHFDKPPVKAIVIACNTATAYGIEDIRSALKAWGLEMPVIGVVEAGARAVVEQLPSVGQAPTVGVIATVGTCASNAYPKAIARAAGLAGKPVPLVVQHGSVGLAGAIEGNPAFVWHGDGERPVPYAGPVVEKSEGPIFGKLLHGMTTGAVRGLAWVRTTAGSGTRLDLNSPEAYALHDSHKVATAAAAQKGTPLSFVVLGCTHFPLVEPELASAFQEVRQLQDGEGAHPLASAVARDIRFINPAEYTAKELFRELARSRLRNKTDGTATVAPAAEFFLSVPNTDSPGVRLAADGSLDPDYKQSRETGVPEREDTKVMRMSLGDLPAASSALVRQLGAVSAQLERVRDSGSAR